MGPVKSLSLLSPKQIFLCHPQPLNLVLIGALNLHSTLSFKVFGLYDKIFPYKCNSNWTPIKRKPKCWKTGHSSSTLWILVKNLIFRFSVLRSLLNTFPPPELPHFLLGSHIVVALRLGTQLVGAPFACVAWVVACVTSRVTLRLRTTSAYNRLCRSSISYSLHNFFVIVFSAYSLHTR